MLKETFLISHHPRMVNYQHFVEINVALEDPGDEVAKNIRDLRRGWLEY